MHTQHSNVTTYQWLVFIICWSAGICAGMNANLFSLMLPQAVQSVIHSGDRAAISQTGSYILSLFLVGWMCGGIIFGIAGDRFGRVKTMALSIGLYTLFTGAAALAQTPWELGLCRFIAGLGVGGCMLSMSVMLAENWPSSSRAVAVGALIASYQVGVLLSGLVSSLCPDWRMAFYIGASPVVLVVAVLLFMKEPVIWTNRQAASTHSLSSHMQLLFSSAYRKNILIGSVAFGGLLVGYWASLSWIPTWIQELSPSGGNQKNLATMLHALAAIAGCFTAGWLANIWGRLPMIGVAFLGAFVLSAWMFLHNHTFTAMIYWQHSMLGYCIGLAQAVLYIYLPELFPTHIRGSAVGFCLNCGRLITAAAVLCVGILVPLLGGYSYALLVFACVYLAGFGASLIGEETYARALPE